MTPFDHSASLTFPPSLYNYHHPFCQLHFPALLEEEEEREAQKNQTKSMAEIRNGMVSVRTSFEEVELVNLEEGGTSGSGRNHGVVCGGYFGRRRVGSLRNLGSFSSRSGGGIRRFYEPRFEDEGRTHFLDSCALCKKLLGAHRDIFMYRGDVPFCSEECRQEQIDMDDAKENWSKLALKASSLKEPKSNTAQQIIQVQAAGAVVAG